MEHFSNADSALRVQVMYKNNDSVTVAINEGPRVKKKELTFYAYNITIKFHININAPLLNRGN